MLKKTFFLFLAAILLFVFSISNASATHIICGDTITQDTFLDSDLFCSGNGIDIGASGITLDCNGHRITGPSFYSGIGINVFKKRNVVVKNCNIQYFFRGMEIYNSESNTFFNNAASYNNIGFYIPFSDNNTLINNSANSNIALGIRLHGSSNHKLIGNTANSNGAFGIFIYGNEGHVLEGNTANSNYRGIQLEFARNHILDANVMMFNTYEGLLLYGSNENKIFNNAISQNFEGVRIMANSNSNLIYNNLFNNSNNAFDDGANFWNVTIVKEENVVGGPVIGGNFWSDYNGTDLDGDGIGDTNLPYNSNGNIVNGGDFLPLVGWHVKSLG